MNLATNSKAFEPNELALLKRVFDDMCSERGLNGNSSAASNLAAEVFELYQNGCKDEESLHRHLRRAGMFG